ncbi:acyltransferase [Propioniciclava coleopterorum]|uniref:Acyltransferase n=1 Tax=Propioniciclava coleopterorum TaxID=2714937 RepID=A0A6G7Y6N1_9ACTN|nr:acyltransferase [Propioniciclava coleopterorum]QIK72277.1 acyltransferase [Propioniciclava coleopterorum]
MSTSQVLPRPATASKPTTPRERFAGLDGLRALAILAVFVFHLHDGWLPGGFLGVDVFFVLSGFLITALLVREINDRGRIDLRGFYVRRARRLLPALALCLLLATLIARLVSPELVVGIGRQLAGAATFSTNWLEIASGQSYFDQTAPILFMNLWSLAVEEQFYLLWPIVAFVLLVRLRPGARYLVPLTVAAASTVLMAALFAPGQDATRVYYGTDTHLMGLMLGAALAFTWTGPRRAPVEAFALRHRAWLGPVALAGLLAAMVLLDESSPLTYRGGFAVVSVLTGVLVLATIARGLGAPTPLQRLLDARVPTWIGRRSYGLYLWHWPAIVVADALLPGAPGSVEFGLSRVAAVLATVLVAEASFRFVEAPVLARGYRAVAADAVGRLRRIGVARARAWVALSLVGALAFGALVATAPLQSETARVLVENAVAAEPTLGAPGPAAGSGEPAPGAPEPGPAGAPAPGQSDADTGTAATGTAATAPGQGQQPPRPARAPRRAACRRPRRLPRPRPRPPRRPPRTGRCPPAPRSTASATR